jgi:N-acetylglutamate synthase/N-acetylornithine aminotransferase
VALDPARVEVALQGVCVFRRGAPCVVNEEELKRLLKGDTIRVEIAAGRGAAEERVLTCDLTPGYVELNKA